MYDGHRSWMSSERCDRLEYPQAVSWRLGCVNNPICCLPAGKKPPNSLTLTYTLYKQSF